MRLRSLSTLLLLLACSPPGTVETPTDAAPRSDRRPPLDAAPESAADAIDGAARADTSAPFDLPPPTDVSTTPDLALPSDARPPIHPGCGSTPLGNVDILFGVDNSNSMRENQAELARQFRVLIDQLVNPPVDPATMRPRYPAVRSLHVGVVSSDLGTPGSQVPSCAESDVGDDGLLNPIRNGRALRRHQPWTTAPPGARPARCTTDPNQYPSFLTFEAGRTNPETFREDFVCNAFLSTGGCGLEQQLESVYRALVVRNARAEPGNRDPNAGFVRNDAVLAIVLISDEEDGSVRDCRFREPGDAGRACTDAISAFDFTSTRWSSSDLNLRMYMYTPGGEQDPTWPLERYIDPRNRNRGFLSLKPGHPEQVVFGAIAGVPIALPMRGPDIDWDTLLGRNPNGSDGFVGASPEGPISMRQANLDTACPVRVVPACRREGSRFDPGRPPCATTDQYFAHPSRRIAQVVRRFDDAYRNGVLSSICRNDYGDALSQIVTRIQIRLCPPG